MSGTERSFSAPLTSVPLPSTSTFKSMIVSMHLQQSCNVDTPRVTCIFFLGLFNTSASSLHHFLFSYEVKDVASMLKTCTVRHPQILTHNDSSLNLDLEPASLRDLA